MKKKISVLVILLIGLGGVVWKFTSSDSISQSYASVPETINHFSGHSSNPGATKIINEVIHQQNKNSTTLKKEIDKYLKAYQFNGTALVIHNGQTILKQSYGDRNMTTQQPNTIETIFPAGSVTKYVTAMAILQLQEQGGLSVGDPLSKYYNYAPYCKEITLYNLLTHTSGLTGFKEDGANMTRDHVVRKILSQKHLSSKPGTQWAYQDANYALLGAIVEKVSGMNFQTYVEQNIFEPNHITNAYVSTINSLPFSLPTGYYYKHGTYGRNSIGNLTQFVGSGDLFVTLDGLYQLDKNLVENNIISADSFKQMTTPFLRNYGLGLYSQNGMYENNGAIGGYTMSNYFNKNTYIILMSNVRGNYNVFKMKYDIKKMLGN